MLYNFAPYFMTPFYCLKQSVNLMSDNANTIYYTLTDEAPALATSSLLPIVRKFTSAAGIDVKIIDISLAGRVLSAFPGYLTDEQKAEDGLAFLGALTQDPNANFIKLPNISASIPQLKACIAELQSQGYAIPDYPEAPETKEDQAKGRAISWVPFKGQAQKLGIWPKKGVQNIDSQRGC